MAGYNESKTASDAPVAEVDLEFQDDTNEPVESTNNMGWSDEEVEEKAAELLECIAELWEDSKGKRERILKWRRQSEAVPETRLRNINPLKNPSNIVPPLTQTLHQGLAAWIIDYFDHKPFLSVKNLQDTDQARLDATMWTKYLGILAESPSDLNLDPVKRRFATETALIGRCFAKVVWDRKSWAYKKFDLTDKAETVEIVYHEGPQVVLIPPEELLFSPQWNDLYDLPMIAHMFRIPRHELEARAAREIYDPEQVAKIVELPDTILPREQQQLLRDSGVNPTYVDDFFDCVEVWFYCDHDGDGIAEEHIWTIHLESATVLRQDYNQLGARMFEIFRWIAHTYDLDGRGVGQSSEGLQDEASSIHNIRNDAMKMSAMRMLQMPSSVLKANSEELFNGKIWVNDQIKDAPIMTLQTSEVYPSSLEAENRAFELGAQANAFSEVQRGFSDPVLKSRDTWRGQAMRNGQSQGITSTIANEMLETWNRITLLIVLQLIGHRDEVLAREAQIGRLTAEEQTHLSTLLSIDPKDVPNTFSFVANTVDSSRTDEAKMQGLQLVSAWYQQWIMQATPAAQMLFSPQGQLMMQQAPDFYNFMLKNLVGSTKLIEEAMTLAGIDDAGSYLPKLDKWEMLIQFFEQAQGQQTQLMERMSGQPRQQIGGMNAGNGGSGGAQGAEPLSQGGQGGTSGPTGGTALANGAGGAGAPSSPAY